MRTKVLKTLLIGLILGAMVSGLAYAAPKDDKDKGENNGKGQTEDKGNKGDKDNKGQAKGKAGLAPGQLKKINNRIEKGRKDADKRAYQPARIERGRSAERFGKKEPTERRKNLIKALDKARWAYHPRDERGQGNMGKVDMRDPYGHDKDSGREGSERGRAIHGPSLDELLIQGELFNLDFTMPDDYFVYRLQQLLEEAEAAGNQSRIALFKFLIYRYTVTNPYPFNWIKPERDESVDFTLTFDADRFEGTNLIITTTIMSATDYDYPYYTSVYDPATNSYKPVLTHVLHYDYGQIVMEKTEEITLGENNTLSFSYDVPDSIGFGVQLLSDLIVTVTDPATGANYSMTYDKELMLARCPYGKVYDKRTGQPIVGAKVTVHFEDGSIVPLDKSTNSNASNPQITDATGRYGFKLMTNRKYYLKSTAPGYKEYKSDIFTEKWHVLREDISLTPIE